MLIKKRNICALSLSSVQFFATPLTVASKAPLFMGILQARILEWVARPSSRRSSQPRDQTQVFHTMGGFFTIWATRETQQTIYIPTHHWHSFIFITIMHSISFSHFNVFNILFSMQMFFKNTYYLVHIYFMYVCMNHTIYIKIDIH